MLTFRILGPLDVVANDQRIEIGGLRQKIVLSMLVLGANREIPIVRLMEAVWENDPPATARNQIQAAISDLRRRFAQYVATETIVSRPAGYLLRAPEGSTDIQQFSHLVAGGRQALRAGDPVNAAMAYREALGLWRGDIATGIDSPVVKAATVRLLEERLRTMEECIAIELDLGRHREVVGELQELVAQHPVRERLAAHLMLALYRSGRHAEALNAFSGIRTVLATEYGLDPGPHLVAMERAILATAPALDLDGPVEAPSVTAHIAVPRQLPPTIADFTGRVHELGAMTSALAESTPTGQRRPILLSGQGGVGKTELAVHVAHQVQARFPGGQVFVRLTTGDDEPLPPEEVLRTLLRSLGISGPSLPTSATELASLLRSRICGSRVLMVLDNAVSSAQVLPALPGDDTCGVIITSRRRLPGLSGALRIELGLFNATEAVDLLSRVLGSDRVHGEPGAAQLLADACGRLPLAIRIAAAKLSVRPHRSIEWMVERLSDERRRLDELILEGVGVRASISQSMQSLSPASRRLLLLLGTLNLGDFAEWIAGVLLDVDDGDGSELLQELVDTSLLEVHGSDANPRHRLHDLIRAFVREVAESESSNLDREEALRRLLQSWLFVAETAHQHCYGGDFTILHSAAPRRTVPQRIVDAIRSDAMAWFDTEHRNLVAAVALAASAGETDLCWDLAATLATLFEAGAHVDSWRHTHQIALMAAQSAGSERGEAVMRYSLAALALFEDRLDDARRELTTALDWFRQDGDPHGRGLTLRNLAMVDRLQGRLAQAHSQYLAALVDVQTAGDRVAEAHILLGLAQIHTANGEFVRAEQLLNDALTIALQLNVRRIIAQTRHRLGHLRMARGRLADAEEEFTQALRLVTEAGDPVGQAYAVLGLALVNGAAGEADKARILLDRALALTLNAGDPLCRARILLAKAEQMIVQGEAGADEPLAEAESLLQTIGIDAWQSTVEGLRSRLGQLAADPTSREDERGPIAHQ